MRKVIFAAGFGNALEWFDFILYAQFYKMIAKHFFPASDMAEILAMAVFAAGFLGRPLGALVFGSVGDRFGRRIALIMGIVTMAIPTAAIGLLPSYETIGITSTILLILMRMMQGFSLGGEFSTCIAYVVEHSPPSSRGFAGSTAFMSMCIGMLLGSGTSAFMSYYMLPEDIVSWGWRMPFIAGLFIGVIGLYIRLKLAESPLYKAAKATKQLSSSPIKELFKNNWKELFIGIAIYITVTTPFFTSTVYVENFMKALGYSVRESGATGMAILITMIIIFPISAKCSDIFGRRFVLFSGLFGILATTLPAFWVIGDMSFKNTFIAQIGYAAVVAWYMGPVPTVLVELFPTRVRLTGVALSYNVSAALFGGTAPMMAMVLQRWLDDKFAIAYYIMGLAIFTLFVIRHYKESYKKSLIESEGL
jgi:MHS family proline/betaine transporter-like MFS transporter